MSAIPLHLAAFDGDDDAVNRFLAQGVDVQALTERQETPLLFAVTGGHVATVRTLLKYGADVNLLPKEGNSPLRRAIQGGHAEVVRLLLARGADPNAVPPPKIPTPEEKAAAREQMRTMYEKMRKRQAAFGIEEEEDEEDDSTLEQLLNDDNAEIPEPEVDPVPGQFRCLLLAIGSRDFATVKTVLDAGYSPNAKSPGAISVLDFAQINGTGMEIPRLLLQYGANPNGEGSISPLFTAVMKNDIPFAELLIEAGARTEGRPMGFLACALHAGHTEMVDFLIERNIGIDDPMVDIYLRNDEHQEIQEKIAAKRGTDWLALVKAGDVEGVRVAINNGADLQARDKDKKSALTIAVKNSDVSMVRVLQEAGCKTEADDEYGVTPLHYAARIGSAEIIEILLNGGAEVGAINKFGRTPLMEAAFHGHSEAADQLIAQGDVLGIVEAILLKRRNVANSLWQSGTPINYANDSGMTALHAAVSIGDLDLVKELLDRGAEVTSIDLTERTPLLSAIQSENEALVSLLLDRGADPDGVGEKSPLYYAAVLMRNEPITRLLLEYGAPIRQTVSEEAVSRIEKAVTEEGENPETSQRMLKKTLKSMERRSQLVNALLQFHRICSQSKDPILVRPDAKWRNTDRLWAVVQTLIVFGADVNTKDNEGNSILSSLIEFDAPLELIRTVFEKGAEVNPSDKSREAPLMLAVERGRSDVAQLLLDAGANPNGGVSVQSPLEAARAMGRDDLIKLLIEKGASDEVRQAMIEELGEDAQWFLRNPPSREANGSHIFTLDTVALNDSRKAERASKIIERRKQLEIEVAQNSP
jgi:ankyrin repeat protein